MAASGRRPRTLLKVGPTGHCHKHARFKKSAALFISSMFFTSLTAASIYNKNKKEYLDDESSTQVSNASLLFLLTVFLFEIALFVWAVILAVRCGKKT